LKRKRVIVKRIKLLEPQESPSFKVKWWVAGIAFFGLAWLGYDDLRTHIELFRRTWTAMHFEDLYEATPQAQARNEFEPGGLSDPTVVHQDPNKPLSEAKKRQMRKWLLEEGSE
jgi:hypothetical protein